MKNISLQAVATGLASALVITVIEITAHVNNLALIIVTALLAFLLGTGWVNMIQLRRTVEDVQKLAVSNPVVIDKEDVVVVVDPLVRRMDLQDERIDSLRIEGMKRQGDYFIKTDTDK